ncbi:MAG: hypothetical protein ACXV3V_05070 [Actinomycetes bacterium]
MSSRRPPSQRNGEYAQQHRARQIQSMTPGTAGGRLASAAPVRVGSDALATVDPGLDASDSASLLFAYDTFSLSAPATSLALSFVPADGSLHVYLNGLEQLEGTDYTLNGLTVTVLAAMGTGSGDVVDARYAYTAGQETVMTTGPTLYGFGSDGATAAPAGGASTPTPALTFDAGDLLVVAVVTVGSAPTPPAGFTLLDSGSLGIADFRVWSKVATGSGDSLTVSGLTDQYGLVAYALRGSTLSQHAISAAVSASNAAVSIVTPSLTPTVSSYPLHIFAVRGDYSAARITLPTDLTGTVSAGGSNVLIAAGLGSAAVGTPSTDTASGSSYAGIVDGRGAQILATS